MMAFASAMAVDLNGRNFMRNDEFNTGMKVAVCIEIAGLICVCIALIKWVYGLFAYSIFIKEDRVADQINSSEATVWFWIGWGTILFAGLLFYAYKPSGWGEDQRRKGTNDYPNEEYDDSEC